MSTVTQGEEPDEALQKALRPPFIPCCGPCGPYRRKSTGGGEKQTNKASDRPKCRERPSNAEEETRRHPVACTMSKSLVIHRETHSLFHLRQLIHNEECPMPGQAAYTSGFAERRLPPGECSETRKQLLIQQTAASRLKCDVEWPLARPHEMALPEAICLAEL